MKSSANNPNTIGDYSGYHQNGYTYPKTGYRTDTTTTTAAAAANEFPDQLVVSYRWTRTLIVGNLPESVNPLDIQPVFELFGPLSQPVSVHLQPTTPTADLPMVYALVKYQHLEDAYRAKRELSPPPPTTPIGRTAAATATAIGRHNNNNRCRIEFGQTKPTARLYVWGVGGCGGSGNSRQLVGQLYADLSRFGPIEKIYYHDRCDYLYVQFDCKRSALEASNGLHGYRFTGDDYTGGRQLFCDYADDDDDGSGGGNDSAIKFKLPATPPASQSSLAPQLFVDNFAAFKPTAILDNDNYRLPSSSSVVVNNGNVYVKPSPLLTMKDMDHRRAVRFDDFPPASMLSQLPAAMPTGDSSVRSSSSSTAANNKTTTTTTTRMTTRSSTTGSSTRNRLDYNQMLGLLDAPRVLLTRLPPLSSSMAAPPPPPQPSAMGPPPTPQPPPQRSHSRSHQPPPPPPPPTPSTPSKQQQHMRQLLAQQSEDSIQELDSPLSPTYNNDEDGDGEEEDGELSYYGSDDDDDDNEEDSDDDNDDDDDDDGVVNDVQYSDIDDEDNEEEEERDVREDGDQSRHKSIGAADNQ
ncbi:uncharacterized protein LOC128961312 [Oppia nitens]|uniref:uncharacterized protein LOC128961312 n=1 Tax=Oppia nitens TaxID=1686743 RepID=UPI0023DBBDD0|nr:uncharacterized protein LOC128961312 [Oppia nitens]